MTVTVLIAFLGGLLIYSVGFLFAFWLGYKAGQGEPTIMEGIQDVDELPTIDNVAGYADDEEE